MLSFPIELTLMHSGWFPRKPALDAPALAKAVGAGLPSEEFADVHGNIIHRVTLGPGRHEIRHDALGRRVPAPRPLRSGRRDAHPAARPAARAAAPDISAWDVVQRRYGVCRDFAHTLVALCRTFNLPARYVSGHLPDIGYPDPDLHMDFHAHAEVYLGGLWRSFDARFNVPRIGRIKVAGGLDAVDGTALP